MSWRTRLAHWVNEFEEIAIATLLGLMTAITFANVVARYVFHSGILWGLEATTYLFAWLVLFGASYAVKTHAHLGVDALVNVLPRRAQKAVALLAVAACLLYAGMLVYGGWEYWYKFYGKLRFLEAEDVPFPAWIQHLVGLTEDGEPLYDNLPRYIPYFILPFGMALLFLRLLQAGWRIWKGEQCLVIASHEADDLLEDLEEDIAEHPDLREIEPGDRPQGR
ncbi:MAG: TRAP transporter small permease [Gammaproteobacteria bacterium]|nr:MAG: TRAP transporter small permease [Gammaproteobacteria bacterium]